jgi:two-component system, sensor histidine kinase RegB
MRRTRVRIPVPTAADEGTLWLSWLLWLRWVAIVAQLITLAFVFPLLASMALMGVWVGVVAVLGVANAWVQRLLRGEDGDIPARTVFAQLALDVAALTVFFYIGGGTSNPFTSLYLVHVAMAGIMLPPRLAGGIAAWSLVCYGLLFVDAYPLNFAAHPLPEQILYPLGQALAQLIVSTSVAVFVIGVASSLRRRREQLLQARERTARTDRLRSVGTLAAGAAHELNTPLSTMGLRLRRIGRRYDDADTTRDVDVIREQLARCTSIVERLLIGAGDPTASDIEVRPLGAMCAEAVQLWSKSTVLTLQINDHSHGVLVELPGIAFQQALINLLENARQAQEEIDCFDPLELLIYTDEGRGIIEVLDRGIGLPDSAEQVGEPFFTTKPTGTGLGVFVAQSVADGAGGGLQYDRREDGGTAAMWWFPIAERTASASLPVALP